MLFPCAMNDSDCGLTVTRGMATLLTFKVTGIEMGFAHAADITRVPVYCPGFRPTGLKPTENEAGVFDADGELASNQEMALLVEVWLEVTPKFAGGKVLTTDDYCIAV